MPITATPHHSLEQSNIREMYDPRADMLGDMEILHIGDHRIIDIDSPIYAAEEIGQTSQPYGYRRVTVVGEIAAPVIDHGRNDEPQTLYAAVFKAERLDDSVEYSLQGLGVHEDGTATILQRSRVDLRPNAHVVLGNSNESEESDNVQSVDAARIWGEDIEFAEPYALKLRAGKRALQVQGLGDEGVRIRAHYDQGKNAIFSHTRLAELAARQQGLLNETGNFADRKLITRNTTMGGRNPEGTVDLRAWVGGSEAIVVDAKEDPTPYNELRDVFLARVNEIRKNNHGTLDEESVLLAIYDTVKEALQPDVNFVTAVSEMLQREKDLRRTLNLSFSLRHKRGACRQMALASGWLGGEAAELGLLSGRLTADVNQIAKVGAHEWARYVNKAGEVYIIDPMQGYFGRLEDSISKHGWDYFRPGEREVYMKWLMESRAA